MNAAISITITRMGMMLTALLSARSIVRAEMQAKNLKAASLRYTAALKLSRCGCFRWFLKEKSTGQYTPVIRPWLKPSTVNVHNDGLRINAMLIPRYAIGR